MNPNLVRALTLALATMGLAACNDGGGTTVQVITPLVVDPVDAGPFVFRTEAVSRYSRVDRMGQPATATVLIDSATPAPAAPGNAANPNGNLRDAFNRANPQDDAAQFGGGFVERLRLIHFKLAPNLRSFGLTPCSSQSGTDPNVTGTNIDICLAQAAGVVLPDVISLNLAQPDGWPNGRHFDDPVVDRLVAAALLNISQPPASPPHNLNTLAGLPLNPPVVNAAGSAVGPVARNGTAPNPGVRISEFPFLRAKNL